MLKVIVFLSASEKLRAVTLLFFQPTRRLFSSSGVHPARMAAERCSISSGVGSTIALPERGGRSRFDRPRAFAALKSWLREMANSWQIASNGTFACHRRQSFNESIGAFRMIVPP
jgi:hypothetical protein